MTPPERKSKQPSRRPLTGLGCERKVQESCLGSDPGMAC
jgi:hypothetical protein